MEPIVEPPKSYKLRTNGHITDVLVDNNTTDIDGLEPAIHQIVEDNGIKFKRKGNSYPMESPIYGTNIQDRSAMVMEDYRASSKPIGVLIVGTKGNGKTMLAEYISNLAIEESIPVLEVKSMVKAKNLEVAIRAAGDCIVYIDEYSKYYSPKFANTTGGDANVDNSDELLTLFSDKTLGRVLFILTDNKLQNISEFLHNRTGRMLYRFTYDYVRSDVVRDICKYFKVNKAITEFLQDHAKNSKESIDNILTLAEKGAKKSTVDEFQKIFDCLNVKPPLFRRYFIRTDSPDKLTAKIDGPEVIFTVTEEKDIKDKDGSLVAVKGQNISRFKINQMNWRTRKGTVHGVNYAFAHKNEPEKPEDSYDAEIVRVPAAEFSNSFIF